MAVADPAFAQVLLPVKVRTLAHLVRDTRHAAVPDAASFLLAASCARRKAERPGQLLPIDAHGRAAVLSLRRRIARTEVTPTVFRAHVRGLSAAALLATQVDEDDAIAGAALLPLLDRRVPIPATSAVAYQLPAVLAPFVDARRDVQGVSAVSIANWSPLRP